MPTEAENLFSEIPWDVLEDSLGIRRKCIIAMAKKLDPELVYINAIHAAALAKTWFKPRDSDITWGEFIRNNSFRWEDQISLTKEAANWLSEYRFRRKYIPEAIQAMFHTSEVAALVLVMEELRLPESDVRESLTNFAYDIEHGAIRSEVRPFHLLIGFVRSKKSKYESLKKMELENQRLMEGLSEEDRKKIERTISRKARPKRMRIARIASDRPTPCLDTPKST